MRYKYFIHLIGSDNQPFCVTSSDVSKTRIHKVLDFYSKSYIIKQFLVQPCNIQNPPSETKKGEVVC